MVVTGDSGVGKTCLHISYMNKDFQITYFQTEYNSTLFHINDANVMVGEILYSVTLTEIGEQVIIM